MFYTFEILWSIEVGPGAVTLVNYHRNLSCNEICKFTANLVGPNSNKFHPVSSCVPCQNFRVTSCIKSCNKNFISKYFILKRRILVFWDHVKAVGEKWISLFKTHLKRFYDDKVVHKKDFHAFLTLVTNLMLAKRRMVCQNRALKIQPKETFVSKDLLSPASIFLISLPFLLKAHYHFTHGRFLPPEYPMTSAVLLLNPSQDHRICSLRDAASSRHREWRRLVAQWSLYCPFRLRKTNIVHYYRLLLSKDRFKGEF